MSESANERVPARLLVVTGLSGSGKTIALRTLEDQDYYCVDNLPAGLLEQFARQMLDAEDQNYRLIAVGIDARNRSDDLKRLPEVIERLRADRAVQCEVFFLKAVDEAILSRFSETRRRHPLTQGECRTLREAIDEERRLLEPLAAMADLIVDTSESNVHELRRQILQRVSAAGAGMSVMVESFAYKHGVPPDVDFTFDVRCLPNPHWEPRLRSLTGRDEPVVEYLESQPPVQDMLDSLSSFLERWLPAFAAENRSYITIGVGCTGGKHRSVYLAEALGRALKPHWPRVLVHHRELERGTQS